MTRTVPVVLFAYARPKHLLRTLEALRENHVPVIYAFSDGPKRPQDEHAVTEVRSILRTVDWCDLQMVEHEQNLGLGKSILSGVASTLLEHDTILVFEDDLICVPGTYEYLCAALRRYEDDPRVMSVTGWTHPEVTPTDVAEQPYFDGRAECWVWGTWARAWEGMDRDAKTLMALCSKKAVDVDRYGADLPVMAEREMQQNIWAVRFLYHHMAKKGLCLRPPWSMVEHVGFDSSATNARDGSAWVSPPLKPCPPLPENWPEPLENLACSRLWQNKYGRRPGYPKRAYRSLRRTASSTLKRLGLHWR
jgi:hypothetical protein